jgi:hypothetical protein
MFIKKVLLLGEIAQAPSDSCKITSAKLAFSKRLFGFTAI